MIGETISDIVAIRAAGDVLSVIYDAEAFDSVPSTNVQIDVLASDVLILTTSAVTLTADDDDGEEEEDAEEAEEGDEEEAEEKEEGMGVGEGEEEGEEEQEEEEVRNELLPILWS